MNTETLEIISNLAPIIFYFLAIIVGGIVLVVKIINIVKKAKSGEDVTVDLESLESELSEFFVEKFLTKTKKAGVAVDETVTKDVIQTTIKTLVENYSNQLENTKEN